MAVASRLAARPTEESDPAEVLYLGSATGPERELAERAALPFHGLDVAGGLRGMGLGALGNGAALIRGLFQAHDLLGRLRPDAILATGGYVCVPVVLAGWLRRVPSLVYLPDTEPGWAIRFLAPFAARVAITVQESARFFGAGKSVHTGYPVRDDIAPERRPEARLHFGVAQGERVVLVAGGSRGARRINEAIAAALPELLTLAHVIHVSGRGDHEQMAARADELPDGLRSRYHLFDYLHEMPLALAAADLAISRSGASVLGEYPAVGLPAVLVPYAGGHRDQELNASYLASHGAAVVVADDGLTGGTLLSTVQDLLADAARLPAMSRSASSLARPGAADRIAAELRDLAKG